MEVPFLHLIEADSSTGLILAHILLYIACLMFLGFLGFSHRKENHTLEFNGSQLILNWISNTN